MAHFSVKKIRVDVCPNLIFGVALGLSFQTYKNDLGLDTFWNIRLLYVSISGCLLFYVVRYLDARLLYLMARNYDRQAHYECLIANIPLLLPVLNPLQRRIFESMWPKSVFLPSLGVFLGLILLLKIKAGIGSRRRRTETLGEHQPFPGKASLCASSLILAIPVFLLHQFSLVFDGYYKSTTEAPVFEYIFDNYITQKISLDPSLTFSKEIKSSPATMTIAYKFSSYPDKKFGSFTSIPFRFETLVKDNSGKTIFKNKQALNALSKEGQKWQSLTFEIPGNGSQILSFSMRARPQPFEMDPRFMVKVFTDISYSYAGLLNIYWKEPESSFTSGIPRVILISIDTLRSDRLGCYGNDKKLTPAIDGLAEDAVLYKNAFAQSTYTLPSHLSLLTSKFPNELRIPLGGKAEMFDYRLERSPVIDPKLSLAEILSENGYYCAGFTEGCLISSYYGFHRGFRLYDERYGDTCNSFQRAQSWLDENLDKDCFLFIHTYFVHDYLSKSITTPFRRSVSPKVENLECEFPVPRINELAKEYPNFQKLPVYDRRVYVMDTFIDTFLTFLKDRGLYDDALIVFTSDHGESFGETHRNDQIQISRHGNAPYESQIRVPLIIKLPKSDPSLVSVSVSEDVALIDVAPTILSALGIQVPADFQGRPLLPLNKDPGSAENRLVFASGFSVDSGCIRSNGKKYMRDDESGEEEFYDLRKDPLETNNLASVQSAEMLQLKEAYLEFRNTYKGGGIVFEEATRGAPSELAQQMRALGYLQ